jgi:hypothetical protein
MKVEAGAELLPLGRVLATEDRAHDLHVLADLGERLVDRLVVPALDHRLVGDAQSRHGAPARELIERGEGLRHVGRCAGVDRNYPGSEPHALAVRRVGSEERDRVARRDVRHVDGLVAELLGSPDAPDGGIERASCTYEGAEGHGRGASLLP